MRTAGKKTGTALKKPKTTRNLGVAIPIEMHEKLMMLKRKTDYKLSQLVRRALREFIERESK